MWAGAGPGRESRGGEFVSQLSIDFPSMPVPAGLTHAVLPDMGTACAQVITDLPAGDQLNFGSRWHEVTCPWCHSLGHAWFWHVARQMQGRAA